MENQHTISWEAWEFKHYPKSLGWYVTLISVSVLVVAFFIFVESDIFAAVSLAIIAALIIIFSRQLPQKVNIELSPKGVKFGNLLYPHKQLKYFWIVNNQNHKTLNLQTSAFVNNTVILELEDQDPEVIRNYLIRYLPEHPQTEETPAQKIMHKLKF